MGRDTLLLVLQAAPEGLHLSAHLEVSHRRPNTVQRLFRCPRRRREADRFTARGYDIYLRPSGAFSTLGWFEDPLLSTAISSDSVELAATVFHEIAHNTLYVKSATPFNESFAQLVGYRSAEAFFRDRGDSVNARHAADRWHDEIVLGDYYSALVRRLDSLYSRQPDSLRWRQAGAKPPPGPGISCWARSANGSGLFGSTGWPSVRSTMHSSLAPGSTVPAWIFSTVGSSAMAGTFGEASRHSRALMEGVEGDSAYARLEEATPMNEAIGLTAETGPPSGRAQRVPRHPQRQRPSGAHSGLPESSGMVGRSPEKLGVPGRQRWSRDRATRLCGRRVPRWLASPRC